MTGYEKQPQAGVDNDNFMACRGAPTNSERFGPEHMEICQACENCVRYDLIDHWFFGFKAGCSKLST